MEYPLLRVPLNPPKKYSNYAKDSYLAWFEFDRGDDIDAAPVLVSELPKRWERKIKKSWFLWEYNEGGASDLLSLRYDGVIIEPGDQLTPGVSINVVAKRWMDENQIAFNQPFLTQMRFWSTRSYEGEYDCGVEYDILAKEAINFTDAIRQELEWQEQFLTECEILRRDFLHRQQQNHEFRQEQLHAMDQLYIMDILSGSSSYDDWFYSPSCIHSALYSKLRRDRNQLQDTVLLIGPEFIGWDMAARKKARSALLEQIKQEYPVIDVSRLATDDQYEV